MNQLDEILPTSPCTSNIDIRGSTKPKTLNKSKSSASGKYGKFSRSVNFNIDFMARVIKVMVNLDLFSMLFLLISGG